MQQRFSYLCLLVFLVALSWSTTNADSGDDFLEVEYLNVPASKFLSSLGSTMAAVRKVSLVAQNVGYSSGDFRLSNAISDCLDLLDLSSDELSWSLSASQRQNGEKISTGDLSSDLRTWLSAAMANHDTCIEGFEGTSSFVKNVIAGRLNLVTSQVSQLLTMVHPAQKSRSTHGGATGHGGGPPALELVTNRDQLPSWVKLEDKRLLQANGFAANIDVVVAKDGSGNFTKISDAVAAAPDYSMRRFVIYVKRGVYTEYVEINKKKWNILMVGDGINLTVISGNRNYADGWAPFKSATFAANGRGFIAKDITFENTAGPEKQQAVALRSDSDLSVFFRCEIRGYQDSLYAHANRQFYKECTIRGTVDFIFGYATVVFQSCKILAKQGLPSQKNTITAQGRKNSSEPSGFSFQFCNISADIDLLPYVNSTQTYLGRPWKQYSRTVIMESYLSDVVRPEGWLPWNNSDFGLHTAYYAEYMNHGPGSGLGRRVKWAGYHVLNEPGEAINFTVAKFILGDLWLPFTGVKYTAGLGIL